MGSNENPNPQFASQPKIYKFGDEEFSDITFVIGMDEFQCHKEMLSSSSPYFNGMFSSGFKENGESRLSIQEDPVAFKLFLDILYNGWKSLRRELLCCQKKESSCPKGCRDEARPPNEPIPPCCSSSKLWFQFTRLLQLFDKFNVPDKMINDCKDFLCRVTQGKGSPCACGGVRPLIFMFFFMKKPKDLSCDDLRLMADAIPIIKELQPGARFDIDHLEWVLKPNPAFHKKRRIVKRKPVSVKYDKLCSSIVERNNELRASPTIIPHKFGDEELSDVTFIVRGEKFFCHKMFLAARSLHFKELFFPSSGEISPDTVHLDDDAVMFSQMMCILYNSKYDGWRAVIDCGKGWKKTTYLPCPVIPKLWKTFSSLVKLGDSLGVRKSVVAFLDTCFMSNLRVVHHHPLCTCVGAKFLFAVIHGLNEYRSAVFAGRPLHTVSTGAFHTGAFPVIKKLEPNLTFNLDTFERLLRNI